MGKCSKCGKKIEYNNYKVIDGIVYCPNCTPKEPVDPEVVKAELEAEEQFEKTMEGHGQTADMAIIDEALDILAKEPSKPKKKRSKKGKSE